MWPTRPLLLLRAIVLLVLPLFTLASCASRAPRPESDALRTQRELAAANASFQRACYVCLRDAMTSAEAVLAREPEHREARMIAFRAAVLAAVRERQLGIQDHGFQEHAARLAAGLLSSETAPLLDMLGVVPWTGRRLEEPLKWQEERAAVKRSLAGWRALTAGADDPVLDTVRLAVECEYADLAGLERSPGPAENESPLAAWTRATCIGLPDRETLHALLEREPRFFEASYVLGMALLMEGAARHAEAHVAAALAGIPDWPAAAVSLGNVRLALERYEDSRRAYEQALALVPDLAEALLGQLRATSYLEEHEAAVAIADQIIQRGTWYVADARYWRAWNLLHLDRLAEAAEEVGRAKLMMSSPALMKLSGAIALRQARLDDAKRELGEALAIAPDDCEARYQLALAQAAGAEWPATADTATVAAHCYIDEEAERQEQVAKLPPDTEASVRARRERGVAETHAQQGAAFYLAASALAGAGRREEARASATRALAYEAHAARARELLERLR